MEKKWEMTVYRLPESLDIPIREEILEIDPQVLRQQYLALLDRNKKKINIDAKNITKLIEHEKVSLRSKMREVIKQLLNKASFKFSELFSLKSKSKTEVVTGFMAILELAKMKKVMIVQNKQFSDIDVVSTSDHDSDNFKIYNDIEDDIREF
jgi:segregation and condensation protein A